MTETSVCSIKKNTQLANLLLKTHLIVWDKVPMQNKHCFEAVDRTLRDIRSTDSLFGGMSVVFGGDFAQILPVIKRGSRPQIVQACLRQSYFWPQLKVRFLTADNRAFVKWLQDLSYDLELREGNHPNTSNALRAVLR